MPKCNGSTFPSRYAHSGEGTTPLLDPPSSSSYERLSMRKYSGSLPTPAQHQPQPPTKISLSPFTSRLPASLEVDTRLGLHQAGIYISHKISNNIVSLSPGARADQLPL